MNKIDDSLACFVSDQKLTQIEPDIGIETWYKKDPVKSFETYTEILETSKTKWKRICPRSMQTSFNWDHCKIPAKAKTSLGNYKVESVDATFGEVATCAFTEKTRRDHYSYRQEITRLWSNHNKLG